MSLQLNLTNAFQRLGNEMKAIRTLLNGNASNNIALTTTAKNSLVLAINEVDAAVKAVAAGSGAISDGTTSTSTTWSSSKTSQSIAALINDTPSTGGANTYSINKIVALIAAAKQEAKNELTNGAGAALDTLKELADAIGNDASFATNITNSLAKRVRFDAAQTLTTAEQAQACANIGVGNPETDYVAVFNAALV